VRKKIILLFVILLLIVWSGDGRSAELTTGYSIVKAKIDRVNSLLTKYNRGVFASGSLSAISAYKNAISERDKAVKALLAQDIKAADLHATRALDLLGYAYINANKALKTKQLEIHEQNKKLVFLVGKKLTQLKGKLKEMLVRRFRKIIGEHSRLRAVIVDVLNFDFVFRAEHKVKMECERLLKDFAKFFHISDKLTVDFKKHKDEIGKIRRMLAKLKGREKFKKMMERELRNVENKLMIEKRKFGPFSIKITQKAALFIKDAKHRVKQEMMKEAKVKNYLMSKKMQASSLLLALKAKARTLKNQRVSSMISKAQRLINEVIKAFTVRDGLMKLKAAIGQMKLINKEIGKLKLMKEKTRKAFEAAERKLRKIQLNHAKNFRKKLATKRALAQLRASLNAYKRGEYEKSMRILNSLKL